MIEQLLKSLGQSRGPSQQVENQCRLIDAYRFASKVHKDEVATGGGPMIDFLAKVGKTAAKMADMAGHPTAILSMTTGLLHRVLLVQGTTVKDLEDAFDPTIALLVQMLTPEPFSTGKASAAIHAGYLKQLRYNTSTIVHGVKFAALLTESVPHVSNIVLGQNVPETRVWAVNALDELRAIRLTTDDWPEYGQLKNILTGLAKGDAPVTQTPPARPGAGCSQTCCDPDDDDI